MATTSATSGVTTSTGTDAYGNTYTTSVSADGLQSEDFIKLMLKELSLQDPTNPVDSSSMLDSQLQLSTLEANLATVDAMGTLTDTFQQNALSNAASLIGNIVENGEKDDKGNVKQYKVSSVEGSDGKVYLTAYEITGYYDVYTFAETENSNDSLDSTNSEDSITLTDSKGETHTIETSGKTYDQLAEEINAISGVSASMAENASGKYQMVVYVNGGNSSITSTGDLNMSYSINSATTYNEEADTLLYSGITKIY
ncbi:hypothetical protein CRV08_01140 [Halarcobacter ebronensis]|uniref:Basal-body rod modification protein FlgD n=1 Tax=Halarcobacter ebronensis TaxID=1462615 RepID=A0A4Q0YLL8_9BACT|nr:flagellar hook capping FlgD N-terminal domain-containing protein [Halarcobacter ebronensis]RXJ70199.1 hypothetical protein CRV08_01140 [Halarcobacter ebronensis]